MAKTPTEIMEILSSYDLTRCAWSAAQLMGCNPKCVLPLPAHAHDIAWSADDAGARTTAAFDGR